MSEKYEAEKARALNFQRLLAQEEKRTGELDTELKRVKRDNTEIEAKSRELTAQLQAVREQLGRVQEEAQTLRDSSSRDRERSRAARSRRESSSLPSAMSSGTAPPPAPSERGGERSMDLKGEGEAVTHEVRPGETLFRLSRQYGVNVETIKHWNHLEDDVIEVGQKLVVGYR